MSQLYIRYALRLYACGMLAYVNLIRLGTVVVSSRLTCARILLYLSWLNDKYRLPFCNDRLNMSTSVDCNDGLPTEYDSGSMQIFLGLIWLYVGRYIRREYDKLDLMPPPVYPIDNEGKKFRYVVSVQLLWYPYSLEYSCSALSPEDNENFFIFRDNIR